MGLTPEQIREVDRLIRKAVPSVVRRISEEAAADNQLLVWDDDKKMYRPEGAAPAHGTADWDQHGDVTLSSEAQGEIVYYNGTAWVNLPVGTSGEFLQTNGGGNNPSWVDPHGSPGEDDHHDRSHDHSNASDGSTVQPSSLNVFSTLRLNAQEEETISSGAIPLPAGTSVKIQPESGNTDDLNNIPASVTSRVLLLFVSDAADTITVKHDSGVESNNIHCVGGADFDLVGQQDMAWAFWWNAISKWIIGKVGGGAGGHNSVTLDANADTVLELSAQELGLDTQSANRVWAGPTSGGDAVPSFRALVAADIPGDFGELASNETASGQWYFSTGVAADFFKLVDTERTISSGRITSPGTSHVRLQPESGNSDTLVGITPDATGALNDQVLLLTVTDAADSITIAHEGTEGSVQTSEKFWTKDGSDVTLSNDTEKRDYILFIYNGTVSRWVEVARSAGGGGGGTPGGSDTQVQYNDSGAFVGDAGMTYDAAGDTLTLAGAVSTPSIEDSGGTAQITIASSSPHVLIENDQRINGVLGIQSAPNSGNMINIQPTLTGVTGWVGVSISPTLTISGSGRSVIGVQGNATANVPATSGHTLSGLDFQAVLAATASGTATASTMRAIAVRNSLAATQSGRTAAATTQSGVEVLSPAFTLLFGGAATVATMYGVVIRDVNTTNAAVTITDAIGLRIEDFTSTRISGDAFLMEVGPSTPYLRVEANWTATANETPLLVSEGATPTLRRLKTVSESSLDTASGTKLICYLE